MRKLQIVRVSTLLRSLALLTVCVVFGSLSFAQSADGEKGKAPASWYKDKDTWVALGAVAAFLSAASPLFSKGVESVSLVSRRKNALQHIQDLAGLMEKIKKDGLLSETTLANTSAQIEAEIQAAVDGLDQTRTSRLKALERKEEAHKKKQREYSNLNLARRVLLLYRPHSAGAWVALILVYVYGMVIVEGLVSPETDSDVLTGALIISVIAWISAWRARRRWERLNIQTSVVSSGIGVPPVGAELSEGRTPPASSSIS